MTVGTKPHFMSEAVLKVAQAMESYFLILFLTFNCGEIWVCPFENRFILDFTP